MSDRLEPQILRAAQVNDVQRLQDIVRTARTRGSLNDKLLGIALKRSSEKGNIEATRYLLTEGAKADGEGARISSLILATEHNHIALSQLLLEFGANIEARDKNGLTVLMIAALKNHWHILNLLIARGADVNVKTPSDQNVLHILAASKEMNWGDDVVDLLLSRIISIDGKDNLGRTPLHWACATGKLQLTRKLLSRPGKTANIEAVEIRGKTALHLATIHYYEDIVENLLAHGAYIESISDGGWTPLHMAVKAESTGIVRRLISAGAHVNVRLVSGITPLHLAAQSGNLEIVRCLVECKDIEVECRDTFGSTPLHRAAQNGHTNCYYLLAPSSHVESLSEDAIRACKGFNATVVCFGNYRNGNYVQRIPIYDLLYDCDPVSPRKSKSIWPKSNATTFQWIHLPANNLAWVQALFTGSFIEEGGRDVEFMKSLEQTFTHQHRGQKTHSHFMRPLCQVIPRAQDWNKAEPFNDDDPTEPSANNPTGKTPRLVMGLPKLNIPRHVNHSAHVHPSGVPHLAWQTVHNAMSPLSKRSTKSPGVVLFMPYLHFETNQEHEEMQEAIIRAEGPTTRARRVATTPDEMQIRAYLAKAPVSMHVRRTLDQCFFHDSDTRLRDNDQVVYRYQLRTQEHEGTNPKIIMVDQLWMWILDDERIVTAFPQRWQQPKHDPSNVLNAIMDEINSRTSEPIKSVYHLSMLITERCSSVLDDNSTNAGDYQFFKMFESSIGIANDIESNLFMEFNQASLQASEWLERSRKKDSPMYEDPIAEAKNTAAVDKLLYIGNETNLLTETKDIRDELGMLSSLYNDQIQVLPEMQDVLCEISKQLKRPTHDIRRRFGNKLRRIDIRVKDLERMDKQTARIYSSILDMLDLKQKHAANTNVFEARFAREQAEGSARQNQILMVFTIVTIIFLPLSFIAAFFTINIREFQEVDGNSPLTLKYVSKWVFGVGLAVAIPMVVLALNLGRIVRVFGDLRMLVVGKRRYEGRVWEEKEVDFDAGSFGKRRSMRSVRSQDVRFTMRQNRDVELGGRGSMKD